MLTFRRELNLCTWIKDVTTLDHLIRIFTKPFNLKIKISCKMSCYLE